MPPVVKIFFDGGCRPVPFGMEIAVVIKGRVDIECYLGPGTSLDAEWLALIRAVELTLELKLDDPLFLGDSLAVVDQVSGRVKCRGVSVGHFQTLQTLVRRAPLRIRHVKRTQNLAGIALAIHAARPDR